MSEDLRTYFEITQPRLRVVSLPQTCYKDMAGVGLEPRSPEPTSFLQGQAAEEVLTATLRESTGLATAPEETSVSVRTLRQLATAPSPNSSALPGHGGCSNCWGMSPYCFIGSTHCACLYLQAHILPSPPALCYCPGCSQLPGCGQSCLSRDQTAGPGSPLPQVSYCLEGPWPL